MPTRWVKKGGKLELKEITWNRILFGTCKDPGEAWVVGATLYTIAYDKSRDKYHTVDKYGNSLGEAGYQGKNADSLIYEKRKAVEHLMKHAFREDPLTLIPQN